MIPTGKGDSRVQSTRKPAFPEKHFPIERCPSEQPKGGVIKERLRQMRLSGCTSAIAVSESWSLRPATSIKFLRHGSAGLRHTRFERPVKCNQPVRPWYV